MGVTLEAGAQDLPPPPWALAGDGVLGEGYQPYPHLDPPSDAWTTVAMGCAVAPLISSVCVTWAGLQTCHRPRLRRVPRPPAAPGTVAATYTAIAASGGLASAMSARVSAPHRAPPRLGLGFLYPGWAFPCP